MPVARCVILSALLALPSLVSAATPAVPYTWRNVAVRGGGYVTGLVYHPREPDLLYARTDVGGAARWDPATQTWIALNDDLDPAHAEWTGVLSLAVDPNDASRLYLACGSYLGAWAKTGAVLRSADRGATWEVAPLSIKLGANEDGRSNGERLQVDPVDGRKLWLGSSRDGLWRSVDRGASWERVKEFPATSVTFVLLGKAKGSEAPVLYVGGADAAHRALYRSRDDGATWAQVEGQPADYLIHHAAFDGAGRLYLAASNGLGPNGVTAGAVWRYDPATGQWTDVSPRHQDPGAFDVFGYGGLDVLPTEPATVVVSTLDRWKHRDEIFRSTDGGATWKPLLAGARFDSADTPYVEGLKPHWIDVVAVNPARPTETWFVTGYGVWQTVEADREHPTWRFLNAGFEETVVDELVVPPGGVLLSAMGDLGGFRHDDLTRSPAAGVHRPFYSSNPSISFAAGHPEIVARTLYGPVRAALSHDGGRTWQELPSTLPTAHTYGPGAIALSADAQALVWLPKGSAPFASTDAGKTWKQSVTSYVSTRDFFIDRPVADPVNAKVFYIYDHAAGRMHTSTDGGRSFAAGASVPVKSGNLQAEPGAEGRLWLPTPNGLLHSPDGGRTFERMPGLVAAAQVGFGRAAPGQSRPTIFASARDESGFGVFRSDDSGRTWSRVTDAKHLFGWLRTLTGDPDVFGRVYLGTSGRGIMVGDPAR